MQIQVQQPDSIHSSVKYSEAYTSNKDGNDVVKSESIREQDIKSESIDIQAEIEQTRKALGHDVEGDELSEGDSDLEELHRPVKVTDKFQKAMDEESYSNSFDEQEEKHVAPERKESDYSEDFD